MNDQPLITIGLTCFNAETTIHRALQSALKQTWENYEIIIVDDCSTDQSVEKMSSLLKRHHQIRLIQHKKNKGVAAARNTIIENANGEFIAFFDDDDQSLSNRLSVQYQKMTEYQELVGTENIICHSARVQIFPDGSKKYEPTLHTSNLQMTPKGSAVADLILIGRPIGLPIGSMATCSQMARRSTYKSVNGFNENLRRSEDTDLNVRLGLNGTYFLGIAEPLVHQTMTSSEDKHINEERKNALEWLNNHKIYLERIGWWEHSIRWLDIKFDYLSGQKLKFILRMIFLVTQFPLKTTKRLIWIKMNRGGGSEINSKIHKL